MIHRTLRNLAAMAAILVTTACGGDSTGPGPGDEGPKFAEIVMEDAQGNLVYSHVDHWHGFPGVKNGETLPVKMYFVAERRPIGEHGAPARESWFSLEGHPDHRVRVTLSDPTLATWTGDRHQATLEGRFPGTTQISWVVLRGTTTVWQSPPTSLVVRP